MDNTTPTPEELRDLLVVLREGGVSRFACAAFEVEFPPEPAVKEVPVRVNAPAEPTPAAGYSALFGGRPPAFKPAVAE